MRKVLTHSDESSGTTVLDNGTKLHWTEGYSDIVIIYPDGQREEVGPFDVEAHPLAKDIIATDYDEMRKMTPVEEQEWSTARYRA